MAGSKYLIVGGGMAADAAVRGIREVDSDGSIVMLTAEPVPPYKRPALSKGLWNGRELSRIWSKTDDLGVDIRLGHTAVTVDPDGKRVIDDRGESHGYQKLLLATGVSPYALSPGRHDGVIYFRTLADYRRLRELADRGEHIAVIGGGFIGSEIAASLATNGVRVTMLFPGDGVGDRVFPRDLSVALNDIYRDRGVEVRPGVSVIGTEKHNGSWVVRLRRDRDGREEAILVDGVVAGLGTRPVIELAQSGGIETGDGIIVDPFLRTNQPDIFAAGDVANVWMPALGERRRVEHEDHAKATGKLAGRAMAGYPEPYEHLPFFYSDLFEFGYEAVGDLDSSQRTVALWNEAYREGVVYYLRDEQVRGVLLWNVWGQVDAARALIGKPLPQELDSSLEGILVTD